MDTVEIVSAHFDLHATQESQFSRLKALYLDWNSKINVISRKNTENFYTEHVLHSLGIAKILSFKSGTEVLDVGTGGGFPGIPLAILFPNVHFHLVDSIGKKMKVVDAVCESLGLSNVSTSNQRAEAIQEKFDFILSRAVAKVDPFYQWMYKKVKEDSFNKMHNGLLLLKGGDLEEELRDLGKPFAEFKLSDHFDAPFFETKKLIYVPVSG